MYASSLHPDEDTLGAASELVFARRFRDNHRSPRRTRFLRRARVPGIAQEKRVMDTQGMMVLEKKKEGRKEEGKE